MLIETIKSDFPPIPRSLLRLDLDQAADRYLVIDRRSSKVVYAANISDTRAFNLLLPAEYTTDKNICVVMLDDSDVYAAVAEDKLQLELVNTSWNAT